MKRNHLQAILFSTLLMVFSVASKAQVSKDPDVLLGVKRPWTNNELIEPASLAASIKSGDSNLPLIFNIGRVEDIEGAKHIGEVSNTENLEKLKKAVKDLPKNTTIVIYCGCCPFSKCPNIQRAYLEMKKLGFKDIKVLNLVTNLKTDWINKGYPLSK